jgi:hypothetical protein
MEHGYGPISTKTIRLFIHKCSYLQVEPRSGLVEIEVVDPFWNEVVRDWVQGEAKDDERVATLNPASIP